MRAPAWKKLSILASLLMALTFFYSSPLLAADELTITTTTPSKQFAIGVILRAQNSRHPKTAWMRSRLHRHCSCESVNSCAQTWCESLRYAKVYDKQKLGQANDGFCGIQLWQVVCSKK